MSQFILGILCALAAEGGIAFLTMIFGIAKLIKYAQENFDDEDEDE